MRSTRLLVVPVALVALALLAPPLSAQSSREPRIAPLESSDAPINLIKVLAHHPKLIEAWGPFGGYILGSSLPARDREMIILRTVYLRRAAYEWGHHSRSARGAGLTDAEIQRIAGGSNQVEWSSFERALLAAAEELTRNANMSDRTWAYLDARYDEKQMMDVIFTVGQYNLASMAVNAMRVPLDPGLDELPEE